MWLSTNSWPWMLLTKFADIHDGANLGKDVENLLAAYSTSLGGADMGVPAEVPPFPTLVQVGVGGGACSRVQ